MHLVSLVIACGHREKEKTRQAREEGRYYRPPQVVCAPVHIYQAQRVSKGNECIELPDGDGGCRYTHSRRHDVRGTASDIHD